MQMATAADSKRSTDCINTNIPIDFFSIHQYRSQERNEALNQWVNGRIAHTPRENQSA